MNKKLIIIPALLLAAALVMTACPHEPKSKPNKPPTGGKELVIIADTHNNLPYIGGQIVIDTSRLGAGDSDMNLWVYKCDSAGNEAAFDQVYTNLYTIKASDHGKYLKVRAQSMDWYYTTGEWVDSELIGPVVNGWSVKTISKYVQSDGYTGVDRSIQNARGLVIDEDGILYVTANVRWGGGRRIIKIDPNAAENSDGFIPATNHGAYPSSGDFITANNLLSDIAIGPDGSFYIPTNYSKRPAVDELPAGYNNGGSGGDAAKNPAGTILRFPHSGGPSINWTSGNIFDALRARPQDAGFYQDSNNPTTNNFDRIEFSTGGGVSQANMAVDAAGSIYITTSQWNFKSSPGGSDIPSSRRITIVKVTPSGEGSVAERFAGGMQNNSVAFTENVNRLDARFYWDMGGITIGHDGNLYIADGRDGGRIKKINIATGAVTTFVGGIYGPGPYTDPPLYGGFRLMGGITYGRDGNYYLVDRTNDGNHWPLIWKITPEGQISRLAGVPGDQGRTSSASTNMVDGLALTEAKFHKPWGIAAAADGTVYVLDNALTPDDTTVPAAVIRKIYFDDN